MKKKETCDENKKRYKKCLHFVGQITRPIGIRPIRPIKPVELPAYVNVVVESFVKKVDVYISKKTVIVEKINKLTEELKTVTVESEKTVIIKKIEVLRKVVEKLTVNISVIESTIERIRFPVRLPNESRKLIINKETVEIVKVFKKTRSVYVKKVTIVNKQINVLIEKLKTVEDKTEKVEITKKIEVLRKIVKVINKKITSINVSINKITKEEVKSTVVVRKNLTVIQKSVIRRYTKVVNVYVKRVRIIRRKVFILRKRLVNATTVERETIIRKINVYKRVIRRINIKIVKVTKEITNITHVKVYKAVKITKDVKVITKYVKKTCTKYTTEGNEACKKARTCAKNVKKGEEVETNTACVKEWRPKCRKITRKSKKCRKVVDFITKPWRPRPNEDIEEPKIPDVRPLPVTPEITSVVKHFTSLIEKQTTKITNINKTIDVLRVKIVEATKVD